MSPSTGQRTINQRARRLVGLAFAGVVFAVLVLLFLQSRYGIIVGKTQSWPHTIQTVVPSAFEVIPGERMVAGGVTVGEITKAEVTNKGMAHVVMGLDDRVWPLPTDTVLTLRMGGTIKYTDRFVEIAKGRASTTWRDSEYVAAKQFVVPVEYASLFNIFNAPARAGLRSLMTNGGPTFSAAAKPFHAALPLAPPVLDNGAAVFRDLGYDQQALSTLVTSTAQLSDAVASSNPGLRTLLDGAANTFGTIASQSSSLQTIIESGAHSLYNQGVVYYHLGRVFPKLAQLLQKLRPGIVQLNQLASPLDSTLREVVNIEPTAVHTLRTVQRSGPTIDNLLGSARTQLMPQLASIGTQAATELNCIRPYTPEVMNTLQSWGAWQSNGLLQPHLKLMHFLVSVLPFPNQMPLTTAQLVKLFPGLQVNSPVAPGSSWNQPWYQPQCGITAANTTTAANPNPANDSENNTYDPNNGGKLVPFPSTSPTYSPPLTIVGQK